MTASNTDSSWPALSYEELSWVPSANVAMPRGRRRSQTGTFEAAVVPEISTIESIPLPSNVLAQAEEASTEIARFDTELGSAVAPFAALLLRSESASSSKIENLTASAKAIALAELGDPTRRNAGIIVANTRAMEAAISLADRLDAQAILDMQSALMGESDPESAGKWRTEQVWIGGSDFGPINADFIPPQHTRVPQAIDDLVAFLQRDDIPSLVQATIAHAQFETIHPFTDGNGRTGRSLIHALLRAKDLTRTVIVPISAGLLANTNEYFDALMSYRRGDLTTIVELMVGASFRAINNGRTLIDDLQRIRASWNTSIRARSDSAAWKLADLLVYQPVVDSPLVQRELSIRAANANAAIEHLEEAGILQKVAGMHRNRKWAATEVLESLDAFAERAGHRTF